MRPMLEQILDQMAEHGWGNLVAALRRVLDGERDPRALATGLDGEDTLILHTLLAALEDPALLGALAEQAAPPE